MCAMLYFYMQREIFYGNARLFVFFQKLSFVLLDHAANKSKRPKLNPGSIASSHQSNTRVSAVTDDSNGDIMDAEERRTDRDNIDEVFI